jgi:hypothetical protein
VRRTDNAAEEVEDEEEEVGVPKAMVAPVRAATVRRGVGRTAAVAEEDNEEVASGSSSDEDDDMLFGGAVSAQPGYRRRGTMPMPSQRPPPAPPQQATPRAPAPAPRAPAAAAGGNARAPLSASDPFEEDAPAVPELSEADRLRDKKHQRLSVQARQAQRQRLINEQGERRVRDMQPMSDEDKRAGAARLRAAAGVASRPLPPPPPSRPPAPPRAPSPPATPQQQQQQQPQSGIPSRRAAATTKSKAAEESVDDLW